MRKQHIENIEKEGNKILLSFYLLSLCALQKLPSVITEKKQTKKECCNTTLLITGVDICQTVIHTWYDLNKLNLSSMKI